LDLQGIPLDNLGNPQPGLLGPVGIQLNAVAKHLSTVGDNLERHAIANTWVDCRRLRIWKAEESANTLGFGHWQRVKAEATFALKTQMRAPFSEELG
jgi:hypothetical protein